MLLRKKLDLSGAVVFVVVAIVWLVCVFVFSPSAQKGAKVLRIIYLCSSAIAGTFNSSLYPLIIRNRHSEIP